MDPIIHRIRSERGMAVRISELCGIKRTAVYQWKRVPVTRVRQISGLLGIEPEDIRPDVFRPSPKRL